MKIGYARVSTGEQDTAAQVTALEAVGCERIFRENASGGRWDREELQRMLDHIRKGDVVVVQKLDRLSRSLMDLLRIIENFEQHGVGFQSLTESIDTTSAAGRMMIQMVGAFAEFERAMIKERTMTGLAHARREGRKGGRRFILKAAQQRGAIDDVLSGRETIASCANKLDVSRMTIHRLIKRASVNP
jgi:DNA invertase Pin-like site-specific DNA recombinase